MRTRRAIDGTTSLAIGFALAALGACSNRPRGLPQRIEVAPSSHKLLFERHLGPPVIAGSSGTARFIEPLRNAFDPQHALAVASFVDRFYRAPANDGYEAVIDHVSAELRKAGFGEKDGFELRVIETPLSGKGRGPGERSKCSAWTPLSGRVSLRASDGSVRVLHAFAKPEDRDRTLLPINAPSCDVDAPIALSLEELDKGEVLVTEAAPRVNVLERAQQLGARAVISANLETYNVDPSGKFRHLDAVQFREVPFGESLPVAMISPRSLSVIRAAVDADPGTRLHLEAQVKWDDRPLRTLCATIRGSDRASEAVVIVSHVQEPGACDNASGVAGLCEGACGVARALQAGAIARPSRSLVFLWGDEFRQSSAWLDSTDLKPVAGLSSDMTGESKEKTGAIALLERMPDPGALLPLEPDEHTPWGKADVDASKLVPNGVALIARCAMLDMAEADGGWDTADHPYESGSDHDVFIARGIPAALMWHFTDFAYHTSLDRMENLDTAELRRTGVALLATALALADPKPGDLERYLRSLDAERDVRVAAAETAHEPELAEAWRRWCDGARQWLRIECLRIPESEWKVTR